MKELNELISLSEEIHTNNVAKGFWPDTGRNKGEMVMLIISEISECMEAHRKNRWYDQKNDLVGKNQNMFFNSLFNQYCKNTIEDEMADIVIRILDYCEGWRISLSPWEHEFDTFENFSEGLLDIARHILIAYEMREYFPGDEKRAWGRSLLVILSFCNLWKIDIIKHVKWKMRFNLSRPHKHNKAY